MLRCRAGHVVEKVKKLKPWQGHIHVRECFYCHNTIDRHELHYSCPEKCRFDVCQYCYKSQIGKLKVRSRSPGSVGSGSDFRVPGESAASSRSGFSHTAKDFTGTGKLLTPPGGPTDATSSPMREFRGQSTGSGKANQIHQRFRSVSTQFLESSYQRSTEVVFWTLMVFAGDYVGAVYIQRLTTTEDLGFPFPFLTAFVSNLVAGLLVILFLFTLDRFQARPSLGELALVSEVDLKMQIILGILVTCEIGAAVKVLSNEHHTMASWFYMLTPVATILVASSNFFRMEVLQKELLTAAGVASFGGILAVKGPLPSLEGLRALQWAMIAVVITVARCLLTQRVMAPVNGTRPGALHVAKAVLLAGSTVGAELSMVYEWSGFWSLPWLLNKGGVCHMLFIIGLCNAISVIAHTRLIQITSATFGALLVPFHTVTVLPIEAQSLGAPITAINWLGLVLCATSAVMYFKARKISGEIPEGYSLIPC
eukprot:s2_g3.t1